MLKIKYNKEQDLTLEDIINYDYELVETPDEKLTKNAIELKNAWKIIIERLKLYDVLEKVEEVSNE